MMSASISNIHLWIPVSVTGTDIIPRCPEDMPNPINMVPMLNRPEALDLITTELQLTRGIVNSSIHTIDLTDTVVIETHLEWTPDRLASNDVKLPPIKTLHIYRRIWHIHPTKNRASPQRFTARRPMIQLQPEGRVHIHRRVETILVSLESMPIMSPNLAMRMTGTHLSHLMPPILAVRDPSTVGLAMNNRCIHGRHVDVFSFLFFFSLYLVIGSIL